MSYLEIMHTYFRGEKIEALFFIIPAGIILVGLGVVALKAEHGGFAWGVAIPCFLIGLVFCVVGGAVGLRTNTQVAQLEQAYSSSPAEMVKAELPRMQKVNKDFRTNYYLFGAIALIGLILHYIPSSGWSRGVGAALVLGAAIGMMIDGFAERRAVPYTQALERIVESEDDANAEM